MDSRISGSSSTSRSVLGAASFMNRKAGNADRSSRTPLRARRRDSHMAPSGGFTLGICCCTESKTAHASKPSLAKMRPSDRSRWIRSSWSGWCRVFQIRCRLPTSCPCGASSSPSLTRRWCHRPDPPTPRRLSRSEQLPSAPSCRSSRASQGRTSRYHPRSRQFERTRLLPRTKTRTKR
jgi:hypothetical protein